MTVGRGIAGLRNDDNSNLIIGKLPEIKTHNSDGQRFERPVLDMNPTVINVADLIQLLIEYSDQGKTTTFLGSVSVQPTNPDERIEIDSIGQVYKVTGSLT